MRRVPEMTTSADSATASVIFYCKRMAEPATRTDRVRERAASAKSLPPFTGYGLSLHWSIRRTAGRPRPSAPVSRSSGLMSQYTLPTSRGTRIVLADEGLEGEPSVPGCSSGVVRGEYRDGSFIWHRSRRPGPARHDRQDRQHARNSCPSQDDSRKREAAGRRDLQHYFFLPGSPLAKSRDGIPKAARSCFIASSVATTVMIGRMLSVHASRRGKRPCQCVSFPSPASCRRGDGRVKSRGAFCSAGSGRTP